MGKKVQSETVVASPSLGVCADGRLRPTLFEMRVLTDAIEFVSKARLGDLSKHQLDVKERYRLLGDDLPSYMRQTLVRDTNGLASTRRANLVLERDNLVLNIRELKRKTRKPTWDRCEHPGLTKEARAVAKNCPTCKDGYPTRKIRVNKLKRLNRQETRLTEVRRRLRVKDYRLMPGGKKRARNRLHLEEAKQSFDEWSDDWKGSRTWYASRGCGGNIGGNEMFRWDPVTGQMDVMVPKPVALTHGIPLEAKNAAGGWLRLTHPVWFHHLTDELSDRIAGREAVRFDLKPTYKNEVITRLNVRASWVRPEVTLPPLDAVQLMPVVGVDLNKGHLDVCRIDSQGNPMGAPHYIAFKQEGTSKQRDGQLREAITQLLAFVKKTGAMVVVCEQLGFLDPNLREKFGNNKKFRATISGFPTANFRNRLVNMSHNQGVLVVGVDAHHTSKVGGKNWKRVIKDSTPRIPNTHPGTKPTHAAPPTLLGPARSKKTSSKATLTRKRRRERAVFKSSQVVPPPGLVTGHSGAAVAIGRRGIGLGISCRGSSSQQKHGRNTPVTPGLLPEEPSTTLKTASSNETKQVKKGDRSTKKSSSGPGHVPGRVEPIDPKGHLGAHRASPTPNTP